MNYKTVKKFYPILVRWWNFCTTIINWLYKYKKNKFIFYILDFIQRREVHSESLKEAFLSSDFYYWEVRPRLKKLTEIIFKLLGSSTGLSIINKIANDWDTKLIEYTPRYSYTRNRGWVTRYYSCSLFPLNYIKLERITFSSGEEENINTYTTVVTSIVKGETIEELKSNTIILYKGFLWSKSKVYKLYRVYKKDLREINKVMEEERRRDNYESL